VFDWGVSLKVLLACQVENKASYREQARMVNSSPSNWQITGVHYSSTVPPVCSYSTLCQCCVFSSEQADVDEG